MYKYFVPNEPDGGKIQFVSNQVPSAHAQGYILPLYGEDGKFVFLFQAYTYFDIGDVIGFMLKPKKCLEKSVKQLPSGSK